MNKTKNMIHGLPGFQLEVIETAALPIPETVPACDIETREEIKISTGNMIHAMQVEFMPGKLLVSKQGKALLTEITTLYGR
jgi:hypothetical protein